MEPPSKLPAITTATIDQQAYAEQRAQFLQDYFKFRQGEFKYGTDALNHLTAMFYVLPANRYFVMDEVKAKAFLDSVDKLLFDMEDYKTTTKENFAGKVRVPEFMKRLDTIFFELGKIMNECGYSR